MEGNIESISEQVQVDVWTVDCIPSVPSCNSTCIQISNVLLITRKKANVLDRLPAASVGNMIDLRHCFSFAVLS